MDIFSGIAGLAQAGVNLYSTNRNIKHQERTNQMQMDFQRQMYDLSRGHALEDWNKQNQYNHPLQQMQRLREAGLNPNLVYGKGAENTAAMVRSNVAPTTSLTAPKEDLSAVGSALGQSINLSRTQAQSDNISANTAVQEAEARLKNIQGYKTAIDAATGKFEYELKEELRDYTIEEQKLNVQSMELKNMTEAVMQGVITNRDAREQLKNTADVAKTFSSILNDQSKRLTDVYQREYLKELAWKIRNEATLSQKDIEFLSNFDDLGSKAGGAFMKGVSTFIGGLVKLYAMKK